MKMVEVTGLRKSFNVPRTRKEIVAVDGINFQVEKGEIFGLLGPNGAGKTTTLRMLATLLPPDEGRAVVAGHDLLHASRQVRQHIGYVSQNGGADNGTTGRENLLLQAQLYGMSKDVARKRMVELINDLEMATFADRLARTYSGGQRRRLDLALGLVHRPGLLFLDEPTLGLDPQNRALLWEEVRTLRAAGTTALLTTNYLDEADSLCDRLMIIDNGTIVAEGTPTELKRQIAGDVITLELENHAAVLQRAQETLQAQRFVRDMRNDEKGLQIYVERGEEALVAILRVLESAGFAIRTVALSRPTLDDVFLRQTGHSLSRERKSHETLSR